MTWSFHLGRILGIAIRVHATFFILLAIFFFSAARQHELGHSVVAMHFGVTVNSITLYPFGGIAALNEIPPGFAKPGQFAYHRAHPDPFSSGQSG